MSLRVVRPGAATVVQDLGRPGFAAAGVPPSGAMDDLACRLANLLVSNAPDAATLEITVGGPSLELLESHVLAVAGAPFETTLDGRPIPTGRSFTAAAGSTLAIGAAREGLRCYLAVAGGVDTPIVLGSRSTLVNAGLGGFEGRPLKAGDVVPVGDAQGPFVERAPAVDALPYRASEIALRAVPGPQEDAFTPASVAAFFSESFRVSPRSDRAGVRLEGSPLEHVAGADLDPEGVVTGAVQVPGDGMPIVLGPDRPATGGYAKIATVIAADMPLLAQARPGAILRFVRTDVGTAREAWSERLARLTVVNVS